MEKKQECRHWPSVVDVDLIALYYRGWAGGYYAGEEETRKYQEKRHQEMINARKCHIFKGELYCFCEGRK